MNPLIVAGHLATVGATTLLVALWIAAGGRLLRRLCPDQETWPAPLPLVTSALIGQGLCALLVLTLGAVGFLRAPLVLGIALLGLVLLRRDVMRLASALRRAMLPEGLLPRATIVGWAVVALVMVVLALSPPWDWDTLMYHQAVPLQFLRSGAVQVPPDNFHVALIGVVQLASLPLLAAGLEAGPAMASVASYLLLAGALVAAARVVADQESGWWSAIFLLGTPSFLLVAITARIDVTVAGALLTAHTLMLLAMVQRKASILVVAAVCFGLAGGMKLHGLAYAAACAPLALVWWRDRRALGLALVAFAVTLAPWLLKNAILLGAPFHPLGVPHRPEPWIAAIAGSSSIPAVSFDRVFAQLGESRSAFNVWDAFFASGALTIELDGRYYGLPLVLLLLPLALFALRRRPYLLALAVPPLLYLAVILIPYPKTNLRYLFPAIPPLILATTVGLRATVRRPMPSAVRKGVVVAVLGVSLATLFPPVRQRIGPDGLLARWALGLISRHEVRSGNPELAAQEILALEASLAGLGDDALVLLLWEARTGGLEARTLADIRLSNWPLLNQTEAPASCLAGTGITHVVINQGSLRYYLVRGASPEVFRLPQLQEFVKRCLTDPSGIPPYLVFRVRGASPGSGGAPPPP